MKVTRNDPTPNPDAIKFVLDGQIVAQGSRSFRDRVLCEDPVAKRLFEIEEVVSVFFVSNVVTVTKAQPRAGALAVNFSGALLKIVGIDDLFSANFGLQDRLTLVRAYSGAGLPLKRIESYSGSSWGSNVNWQHFAFWGNPTEARILIVADWLTLDIPLDDLPMPAALPDSQRGKKPEGYL